VVFRPIDSDPLICVKRLNSIKVHLGKVVGHVLGGEWKRIGNRDGIWLLSIGSRHSVADTTNNRVTREACVRNTFAFRVAARCDFIPGLNRRTAFCPLVTSKFCKLILCVRFDMYKNVGDSWCGAENGVIYLMGNLMPSPDG
jgi:hypothetical protein